MGAWLDAAWGHLAAQEADEIVIAVVSGRADVTRLAAALADVASVRGVDVRDQLVLHEGRWRSLLCTDGVLPLRGTDHQRAGGRARGRRSPAPACRRWRPGRPWSLSSSRTPSGPRSSPNVRRPGRGVRVRLTSRHATRRSTPSSRPWTPDPTGGAQATPHSRRSPHSSRVWMTCACGTRCCGRCRTPGPDRQLRALRQFVSATRQAPPGLVAPVATCAAVASWLVGDGARAQVALDRALRDRPDYSLALLVQHSVRIGLPPRAWREAMHRTDAGAVSAWRHGRARTRLVAPRPPHRHARAS